MLNLNDLTDNEIKALGEVAKGMKYIRDKSGFGDIRILIQGTTIIVEPKPQIKFKDDGNNKMEIVG